MKQRVLTILTLLLCFAFTSVNAQDNYDATTMGNIVRYYETAKWAQSSPFNNQCWTDANQTTHAKTGCVPTAFAIVMRHHGFPAEGIGDLLNQQTGELFTDRTYDYSKMPLTNASGWTTEQQNEVAKLMAHLGHAFGVTFGQGTTSVSIGNTMSERMQNFFNYNYAPVSNQYAGSGQMYDFEEWKKNLKNSLDNGCPVPYAADNKKDGKNDTRHMFVIDGYTENEYFHFNFGWGGVSNGWYKLDNITPTGDDYSWRTTSDGYDSKHQAFFNLMPNTTTYAVTATVNDSNMGTVSINNGTAGSTATANLMQGVTATLTAHPAQGYALANWTKNGVVVGSRTTLEVKVGTDANDYVANFDDEANVYVIKDYIISPSTVGLTGSSKESVVNYQTSDEYPAALSLASTATNGTSLSAMSRISDDQIRLYAYDQATSSTTVKYTLSVPDGYQITEYKFDYLLNSTSYPCTITYSGGTISPNNTTWTSSPVIVNNAKTAEFTISAENAHSSSNFYIKNFTVTVAKISSEGGTGGGTTDPDTPVTPTTYTISVTATEGGNAYVGTGTSTTVTAGNSVMLTATANDGYTFDGWYNGTTRVSTALQYTFTPTASGTYQAKFTANATPEEPSTGTSELAGKKFRLRWKQTSSNKYLNVADNNTHTSGGNGGVSVATLNESSNAQIFYFEASGDGYKLKDGNGYYIKGQEWNVDANTTNAANASVLLFEETTTANEYYIKWNNTAKGDIRYFKVGTSSTDTNNYYPYCDEANKTAAAVWVLEEVIPSNEKTLTVTYSGATWNNEASGWWVSVVTNTTPAVTVRTTDGTPKIGFSTFDGVKHPYLLDGNSFAISVPSNYKIVGYRLGYKAHNLVSKSVTYTNGKQSTGTLTIAQSDEQNTLTVTGLDNSEIAFSVEDQSAQAGFIIKSLEITYIEDTDLETYTVAVTAGENGTATASAETVTEGDNVRLTATANTGYKFVGWYNGETKVSEANPYTFAVTSNISYEARFEELFPDGAYKVYWQADNRGYLAYYSGRQDEAVLADVTLGTHGSNHYASTTEGVDLVWYLITASDGKRYLFHAATGSFLGANPSVQSNGTGNKLSTSEAWAIAVEPNTNSTRLGHYIITTMINGTMNLLCSGCGTSSFNGGHSVRWLVVNDENQKDGGAPLQLVKVDGVTVADNVMSMVKSVINNSGKVPFKVEVTDLRENDPNTHFATITIGNAAVKLAPAHLTQSEIEATLVAGSTLAINHKYRGFEFNGFYIGETSLGESATLTAEQVAAISATTPLVAKFTATNTGEATLFSAEDEFSYRIPAIVKTVKDDKHKLIAISDYRHSFDDIGRDNHRTGTTQVDLVIRTSEDNGATWTAKQTIAEGSQHFGYGDAAAVANGQDILVMAVAGNVFYAYADSNNPQQAYRIYSNDNGANWEKEDISSNMESLFPDYHGLFFGSGKLAVDPNFNDSGKARVYGAILMKDSQGERNYVLYSDNWGKTWNILGNAVAARQNEPKVEILPNGQILLSARRSGGRTFNVFTYSNKEISEGSWDTAANGCDNGGNSTNGEIILLDAKTPNGQATKILLQSQPYGSDRRNVSIWYKELSGDNFTASGIASNWTMGKQVSTQLSAYSAMCLQENGEIALFFEEAPCYGDDHTKGYSMVYVPLTIEEATDGAFLNPNAVVETVTVDVTLTDNEGNTYTHQFDYLPGDAAAIDAALMSAYPFITELGEGNLQGSGTAYTYTNTVTLPFKVSNANTTVWHNIYMPANGTDPNEFYPIYIMANAENATLVAKITEKVHYGNSQYNTYNYADKLAWAVYNVNEGFTFKFKNKLTGKFMAVNGVVSSGNADNVIYTDEANATVFTLTKNPRTNSKCQGDWAITSVYNGTTGYVCNTSASYANATNYTGNDHPGAWVKFVESPDYQAIINQLIADIDNFGAGEGKYTANDAISSIDKDALASMPLNSLNTQKENVQTVKDSYREIVLTVNDDETETTPGFVSITVNDSDAETVNNKFVPANATVSILATANPGYRFVNWTRPAAQASAAARTVAARNSNVVSDQNPYTVTVSEALSLEANFEQIVVDVTLTDAQSNTYNVQLSGFTSGVTKETVADRLREAYPYITLGTTDANGNVIDFGVLNIDGTAYTYTNMVELPFKVSNTTYIWHNIYWPSNTKDNDYPVYWAALSAEDTYVPKVTGSYAYGDHPTYNTKNGNNNISWAIYNVNNGFEFIFKNKVTDKYIQVTSVANGNAQNVQYVENIEDATAFTIEKKSAENDYSTPAQYALAAMFGETKGYLCSTSATGYNYATHYNSCAHQGAWIEFVEAPDYFSKIMDMGTMLGLRFGGGDGKCVIAGTNIEEVNNAMQNSGSITLNELNDYAARMEDAMATENPTWFYVTTSAENGTAYITLENDDPELTSKRVPGGYELTVKATPATGYHFTGWTMNGTAVEGATEEEYTFTVTEATTLVASFEINTYTVNVTAGEGGSATVTHDVNGETVDINGTTVDFATVIKIEATPNDGYKFIGWYNGEELQHSINPHEFAINHDINYTARFEKNEAGSTTNTYVIKIDAILTDGETAANNATGNVQAIIDGIGLDWATSAEVVENATVELVAISDHNKSAYLFEGWYKNGERVSSALSYEVAVTETVTYEARFAKGKVITVTSNNKSLCLPNMPTYTDGSEVAGSITELRTVVRDGEELLISIDDSVIANFTGKGYRVANWTDKDGTEVAGKNVYSFTITVNGDNTYKVNLEKATYQLKVSVNPEQGTMGSVNANFNGTSGTTVAVGHNMEATITATTSSDDYRFVKWTKNGVVVSRDAEYTVPAIENAKDMVDVEYVAHFAERTALLEGYYRIAYDFEIPVAAKAAASRAATDATQTYVISPKTGTQDGDPGSVWESNSDQPKITMTATSSSSGESVNTIDILNGGTNHSLFACRYINSKSELSFNYTIAVPEDFVITGYSIDVEAYKNVNVTYNGNTQAISNGTTATLSANSLNTRSFDIVVGCANFSQDAAIDINSFEVYIQKESTEVPTETVRYYVQSNVANSAMQMTQTADASTIFYYDGEKLLSYDKGTYVYANGTASGLNGVGVENNVTFTQQNENVYTIAAPNLLKAVNDNGTFYVGCNAGTDQPGDANNFVLEPVDKLPITITAAGYASFCAPVAVKAPVTAYYLAEDGISFDSDENIGYIIMTEIESKEIPANEAVILRGTPGDYELDIIDSADELDNENMFSGNVAATYVTDDAYVLAVKNDEVGLYRAYKDKENGSAFLSKSHKMYLTYKALGISDEAEQSIGFRFLFPGTTPIEEVVVDTQEVNAIYDLSGRKLDGIYGPGVYIVNGKKVFIK